MLATGQGTAGQQGEVWPLAELARLQKNTERVANVPVVSAAAFQHTSKKEGRSKTTHEWVLSIAVSPPMSHWQLTSTEAARGPEKQSMHTVVCEVFGACTVRAGIPSGRSSQPG